MQMAPVARNAQHFESVSIIFVVSYISSFVLNIAVVIVSSFLTKSPSSTNQVAPRVDGVTIQFPYPSNELAIL